MSEVLDPVVAAYKAHFVVGDLVVWEVGSRDGCDGVELVERLRGDGSVHLVCVEPNPPQASLIRQAFPWVRVLELAASDKDGVADFIVYEGDEGAVGSSSLNLEWKKGDMEGEIIKVETRRLEPFITGLVDVMKVDVEGRSLEVLKGLGDKLMDIKVLHIETEDWTKSDKKVKKYMSQRGFTLFDERQEWSGMPDLTYVNANLLEQRSE